MKILNLGCGTNKIEGCINVDRTELVNPDMLYDLNVYPFPWKKESIDAVYAFNVLEHVENLPMVLEQIDNVLKYDGFLYVRVPHCSNDIALGDLYHKRIVNKYTFQRPNKVRSGDDRFVIDRIRLKVMQTTNVYFKKYRWMLKLPVCVQDFIRLHFRNVIDQVCFTLQKKRNSVMLTFDDGPSCYTESVLNILDDFKVKATFFVLGENALRYPDTIRRIISEGHDIGIHGYDHTKWLSAEIVKEQVEKTLVILKKIVPGYIPKVIRAPFLHDYHNIFGDFLKQDFLKGFFYLDYTLSVKDWDKSVVSFLMKKKYLLQLAPGRVILLHDGFVRDKGIADKVETIKFLRVLLIDLKEREYKVNTLEEVLNGKNRIS